MAYAVNTDFADVVAALSACAIAIGTPSSGAGGRVLSLVLAVVVVTASNAYGLYDRDALLIRKTTLDEAPKLLQLATTYVLVVWLMEGAFGYAAIAPSQGLFLLCATLTLTLTCRSASRAVLRRATVPERCMFIGDRQSAGRLGEILAEGGNAELVSRMSLRTACAAINLKRGDAGALHHLAQRDGVQRIIVGQSRNDTQGVAHVLRAAKRLGRASTSWPTTPTSSFIRRRRRAGRRPHATRPAAIRTVPGVRRAQASSRHLRRRAAAHCVRASHGGSGARDQGGLRRPCLLPPDARGT